MRFVRQRGDLPAEIDTERLREAVASFPVSIVVVFGSYGTDSVGPMSDLDVAVRFEQDVEPARKRDLPGDLRRSITDVTGIEAVDLIDLDAVGPAIGYDALRTGILVFGDPEEAVELESRLLLRKLDFQRVKQQWDQALSKRIEEGTFGQP